jgi:hypothetical protein
MNKSMNSMRAFFGSCYVALFEDTNEGRRFFMKRPFELAVNWMLYEEAIAHGMAIFDDQDMMFWDQTFSSGPFVIPPTGGAITGVFKDITFGPYSVENIYEATENKPKSDKRKQRRLRISDAKARRIVDVFNKFGKVNGVGRAMIRDGKMVQAKGGRHAIHVTFESAKNLDKAPTEFESWPVVCSIIGKISLDGKGNI